MDMRQVIERQFPPRRARFYVPVLRNAFLHWQWDASEIQKHLPIGLLSILWTEAHGSASFPFFH